MNYAASFSYRMATAINAERFLFSDKRERICKRFQEEGN